jgi:hypothetical protein
MFKIDGGLRLNLSGMRTSGNHCGHLASPILSSPIRLDWVSMDLSLRIASLAIERSPTRMAGRTRQVRHVHPVTSWRPRPAVSWNGYAGTEVGRVPSGTSHHHDVTLLVKLHPHAIFACLETKIGISSHNLKAKPWQASAYEKSAYENQVDISD